MPLARLQQATTLGVLLLAIAWAGYAWRSGWPALAVAGAVAIAFVHAIVLALEFALMALVHRGDPALRARPMELLRAWAGEVLAGVKVFAWRQPFRSRRWPDRLPPHAGAGRRGVLLVHGFVCNRGVWNRWLQRLTGRGTPFVAVDLEPVFGAIDDYVETIEAAVCRLEAATGMAPVVVAHSMGGLAVRRWCADKHATARMHRLVTIATPHHGTWLARFGATRNARSMRRMSPWLRRFAEAETAAIAAHSTCFYSHCDNVVFPAGTATLTGADNRPLRGVAHVAMVDRPEPWAEVDRWLGDATRASSAG